MSVIIPVHNYARYLRDAVDSVRAQTWTDWECIVVDDGSTDDTAEVLTNIASEETRVVAITQPRRGVSAARNTGVHNSNGEFIQFLDADDLLEPDKLDSHVRALRADPELDIVYGPTAYFDAAPTEPRPWQRNPGDTPGATHGPDAPIRSQLLRANPMTIEAPLVRRSAFERVRGFDTGLGRMEDWDFWFRCALNGCRFFFLPSDRPVALVRVHPASTSFEPALMYVSEIAVRRKLEGDLSKPDERALNRRLIDEAGAEAGRAFGLAGDWRRGLRLLLPAAFKLRRRKWFAWSAALLLMAVPHGREIVDAARSRRMRRSARHR